jgi:hypothetical protein
MVQGKKLYTLCKKALFKDFLERKELVKNEALEQK